MHYFIFVFSLVLSLSSCKNNSDPKPEAKVQGDQKLSTYSALGEQMSNDYILSPRQMHSLFQEMAIGDTFEVKFQTRVNSVCKKKGCWMQLDLDGEEEAMVTFKNYEVVVPTDIEIKQVVVEGSAYISEPSVEEPLHFAEDAGKSAEEVQAIRQPEKTFSFLADAVLIAPGS